MRKIILASGSPRRFEILQNTGLTFDVHPSAYEEVLDNHVFSFEKIEKLAYNKALYVAKESAKNSIVIGADTVVVYNDKILTKPVDRNDAYNMLKTLSGVEHTVVTGICIIDNYDNSVIIDSVVTAVEFEKLTDEQINYYIDNYKPYDKAGAYGIQELPDGFVKRVDGSLENVIGLCSKRVLELLDNIQGVRNG